MASDQKPRLVFSDLNWSSAWLQNAVARVILEKGYGYETEVVHGPAVPLMRALAAGETNIMMELWLPTLQALWEEATAKGAVQQVGKSLTRVVWQSAFLIPQYTADANPGLRSVDDIREHVELFVRPESGSKARLITCPPDWDCAMVNEKQVYGYGLQDVISLIDPGSYWDRNAEILGAFQRREDILFYHWWPEQLSARLYAQYGGVYRLEEPGYSEECWEHMAATNAQGVRTACEYRDANAIIAMRTDLIEQAPDVARFFEKWEMSDTNINALLVRRDDSGDNLADVAAWWLRGSDEWKNWVAPGVAEKVLAGL